MEMLYSVEEEYGDGSYVSEFFYTRREDALLYLKQRAAACEVLYQGWEKESGINYYQWRKEEKCVKLYLRMVELGEE